MEKDNKLEHKFPGTKRFLWWIDMVNLRVSLVRPPCYRFCSENRWRDSFKSILKHFIFCREYPWAILPHTPGKMVEDIILEPYFGEKALLREYTRMFGHVHTQPIKQPN